MEGDFLSQVANVAAQAGVKLGHYRPGVIRVGEGHSQMEIQLSCVGPYRGLCQFLGGLAGLERLSRVVQMEVGSGTAESCPATITLVVFFRLNGPPKAGPSREGAAVHG
jgi:Tfp pilus assembly protein PilO